MPMLSDITLNILHTIALVPFAVLRSATGGRVSFEARLIEYSFVQANIEQGHEPRRILDVGCCGSTLPVELAKRGHEVYGIDVGNYPEQRFFTFVRGDATRMPFDDESFDVVTAVSSVEHVGLGRYGDSLVPGGDKQAMKELRRVLKHGGRLLMTVPCGQDTTCYSKDGMPLARVYSVTSLFDLLRGFAILELSYIVKNRCIWLPASVSETERAVENARPERTAMTAIALIAALKEKV